MTWKAGAMVIEYSIVVQSALADQQEKTSL